jgi:hypothetical protein
LFFFCADFSERALEHYLYCFSLLFFLGPKVDSCAFACHVAPSIAPLVRRRPRVPSLQSCLFLIFAPLPIRSRPLDRDTRRPPVVSPDGSPLCLCLRTFTIFQ